MPDTFVKIREVTSLTALSRASIYRLIEAGTFPKQVKLAEKSSAWSLAEIHQWQDDRKLARCLTCV